VYTPENSTQQRSEVWIMNIEGTGNGEQVLSNYDFARGPAWNAEGTQLAVEVAEQNNSAQHDIVRLDLNTNVERPVVATNAWEGGPSWSPDGNQIVYHAQIDDVDCLQLFMVGVESGESQQLIDLAGYDCGQQSGDQWPDWGAKGITFMRRNLAQPDVDEKPTDRVAVLDLTQPIASRITLFRNEVKVGDGPKVRVIPSRFGRWAHSGSYLLFEEERDDGYGLGYLNIDAKDSEGRYPLFTLELEDYTQVDFADWW
jgi:hypothetical protein